jgi:hypothetical protein
VEFVVIGQTAAVLQGAPVSTLDVDIAPAMAFSNAGALSSALRAMDDRHRASPGVPPEIAELGRIGSSPKQFMTRHGALDVVVDPAGGHGFRELVHRSVDVDLAEGLTVRCAALEDVIASKEALAREKDLAALPALRATLARLRRAERR